MCHFLFDCFAGIDPVRFVVVMSITAGVYLLGFWTCRIYGELQHVYYHLKLGICFRYKATGRREYRAGTVSDFCQRCGQPAGYHHWGR